MDPKQPENLGNLSPKDLDMMNVGASPALIELDASASDQTRQQLQTISEEPMAEGVTLVTEQEDDSPEIRIRNEEARLKQEYEPFLAVETRLYFDAELRENFRNDAESIARHALSMGMDEIIFLDQSARGFGLLTRKMLPVVRLEKAKITGEDPATISLPNIHFIDPPKEFSDSSPEANEATLNLFRLDIQRLDQYIDGKKVLVVDEASNAMGMGGIGSFDSETGFARIEGSADQDSRFSSVNTKLQGPRTTLLNTARFIGDVFPSTKMDYHMCKSDVPGGNDNVATMDYEWIQIRAHVYRSYGYDVKDLKEIPEETRRKVSEQIANEYNRRTGKGITKIGEIKSDHPLKQLAYGIKEVNSNASVRIDNPQNVWNYATEEEKEMHRLGISDIKKIEARLGISPVFQAIENRGAYVDRLNDEEITTNDQVVINMLGFNNVRELRDQVRLEHSKIVAESLARVEALPVKQS